MKIPQSLKTGDTLAIVSPAKHIEKEFIWQAKDYWEKHGYKVIIGEHACGAKHYFSGSIQERYDDLQNALNNDDVKAIICARGGYGCLDLVDINNWAGMINSPKWIVGFSDVTVFHQKLNTLNICSLHATMPLNYKQNTREALNTMRNALEGKTLSYHWESTTYKSGSTQAKLLGGNLSILHTLIGTNDQPNYSNSILFIEEVGEYLYAIDRMLYSFSKAGILDQIKGLIIGGMSNLKDTETPYGCSLEEIVLKHFTYRNIPIAFEFMAGHINDNRALILGKATQLTINEKGKCSLTQ